MSGNQVWPTLASTLLISSDANTFECQICGTTERSAPTWPHWQRTESYANVPRAWRRALAHSYAPSLFAQLMALPTRIR